MNGIKRRRDTFDYYNPKDDDIYDNDSMYYYDDVTDPRQRYNGTMEFTNLKGYGGLDPNSRPWGDNTMMIERNPYGPQQYSNQQQNGPYLMQGRQNPYNTQQLDMNQNPYQFGPQQYTNQNPYNTQAFSFNNNHQQQPYMSTLQQNPYELSSGNRFYGETQQIDTRVEEPKTPAEPQVIEKTIEVIKEPEGLNPFNSEETKKLINETVEEARALIGTNAEETRNMVNSSVEEAKNMIKESFMRQSEINKASFEKQMENAKKADDLQKQVEELTQTLANVTNNFGKAMSNLSSNLKNTQDMLRNQTQTISFKTEDEANANVSVDNHISSNDEMELPTSKTQNSNLANIAPSIISKNDLDINNKKQNNLNYIDESPYATNDFDADAINPVKLKDKKSKKADKKAKKAELKKLKGKTTEEDTEKKESKLTFWIMVGVFGFIMLGAIIFMSLYFGGVINI